MFQKSKYSKINPKFKCFNRFCHLDFGLPLVYFGTIWILNLFFVLFPPHAQNISLLCLSAATPPPSPPTPQKSRFADFLLFHPSRGARFLCSHLCDSSQYE